MIQTLDLQSIERFEMTFPNYFEIITDSHHAAKKKKEVPCALDPVSQCILYH